MALRLLWTGLMKMTTYVYRPGIQALKNWYRQSITAAHYQSGSKAAAKEWGISVASRPSTPCMATRLPYNTPIDYDVMKQIEVGEGYLRELLGGKCPPSSWKCSAY